MGNFSYFFLFSRTFRRCEEFLANFRGNMSGWHPYCAVGVSADAFTVVG
jgi:hypothetical protein